MNDKPIGSRLAALLGTLKPKTKQPVSTKVLNAWIAQAERTLGDEAKGGRLGWLIASSVAIAAVQRAIDVDGRQLFLLKGGTCFNTDSTQPPEPQKTLTVWSEVTSMTSSLHLMTPSMNRGDR